MTNKSRKELEQLLRERLEECQVQYAEAQAGAEAARIDLRRGEMPEPDGSQAYRNALVAEQTALHAVTRALKDFNRFILDGKLPEDQSVADGE